MSAEKTISSAAFQKKPLWVNLINRTWRSTYGLGTETKLNKDLLIQSARRECDLTDFGSDFWDEPLDRLINSINMEAKLHPIGRFITKKRLENLLCVRLRAEHYFKKHPEILEQPLYPVTVIVGLQRTGTTKLQRMLSADPDCRPLLSWEALNPAPVQGDEHTGKERIRFAKMSEHALKYMSPGFFAIHPVEHLAPEEDIMLLDVSFLSTTAEATMHVPEYAAWLETIDQSVAYAYGAKLLQLLQWQRSGKRWVLKTPHHLEFPALVSKYYGDVQFVWTHRNAMEAIPSFLSMVAYARSLFSDHVDAHLLAIQWVRKIGYMLDQSIDFRQNTNNNKLFVDVPYQDLINDSRHVLSKIYSHRHESISAKLHHTFQQNENKNPQRKYGKHQYNLSDFGIPSALIEETTQKYQAFYDKLNTIHG